MSSRSAQHAAARSSGFVRRLIEVGETIKVSNTAAVYTQAARRAQATLGRKAGARISGRRWQRHELLRPHGPKGIGRPWLHRP